MTLSTILCPLDFSAASVALVAYAAALAVGTGAELHLLYVQEPTMPAPAGMEAELYAHRAAAEAAGASRVSTTTVHGEAAETILAEAQRQHADLIIIGAHGQTCLSRFLMGNTAEMVVRTAPCPTLLVRE
jgi:nucleotide-binding universal stress UspA family protein